MAHSPLSITKFKIIFSISWLVSIINFIFLLKLYGLSWGTASIDSVISNIILLLACLLLMNTLRYYTPRSGRYLNILIWCIFLTYAWVLLDQWILSLSLGNIEGYKEFLKNSLPIRRGSGFLILACFTLICVVWYNWEEQKENELRKQDAEKLAKEAELFKLRQQMQPHFLFNSLNSINALIGSRPEEARKMVQQLSDFLRGTLKKEETQWVTLQEELQYLQLYLDIEKVRFGNRLTTEIESSEEIRQMKLPALLLQPIVENAIKFGLYDTTGETVIRIQTLKEENDLIVNVSNPFDLETSSSNQGTGFGLKSVQRRLYLLFGRNDLLVTGSKKNIFTTSIKVPQVFDTAKST